MPRYTIFLLVFLAACAPEPAPAIDAEAKSDTTRAPTRTVALTIDDVPGVFLDTTHAEARSANEKLLAALKRGGAHATGFVNEEKLRGSDERAALLELWLDDGHDLGNHTYSHPDLHRTGLDAFQDDVLRGERVTRELMAARGKAPRFFRHPFLHTGESLAKKQAFEALLAEHGYRVAPVTIDNYDYVFARAYDLSLRRGMTARADSIRDAYIVYMDTVFGFYEAQSRAILGREPAQTLLLHVSRLNADAMDDLLAMIRARDYAVVPLDVALRDSAYASPDEYTGPAGITWLHRWAMTRGLPSRTFVGEPEVPRWVELAAR